MLAPLSPSGTVLPPNVSALPAPTLPHNITAEAALLGLLLYDNNLADDVASRLQANHFYEPLHGRIYQAILNLVHKQMKADPITLKPLLERDEALQAMGGAAYLAQLSAQAMGLFGARDFAKQLYDLALLRELVYVGRGLVDSAMDTSGAIDPQGQIEQAESALYKVAEGESEQGAAKSFGSAAKLALDMAEKARNAGGGLSGLTTGLADLNNKTGGLHHSDLIIIAGRPGMGKTALATNIAFNAAQRWMQDMEDGIDPKKSSGAAVAFFSLEMSSDQLATRILSEQSGISSENLRMGKITQNEFNRLANASIDLQTLPLFIDDTAGLTIATLHSRARRMKRQHNIGMIVVDYLQLLRGTHRNAGENRVQEISEISRGLKNIAKDLNVPVIALSQLSRAVEQRDDKRPLLSDLRESGSIEQDADIVMFVYREEYYLQGQEPEIEKETEYTKWQNDMERVFNQAELIIAKQRHGATGKIRLSFQANITKFADLGREGYSADSHE
jgi:replicative DNA helicase